MDNSTKLLNLPRSCALKHILEWGGVADELQELQSRNELYGSNNVLDIKPNESCQ